MLLDTSKATTDPPFSTSALMLYTERPSLFPSRTVSTIYPSSSLAVTAHMANKITSKLPQYHYKIIKVYPHKLLTFKSHSCVSTDDTRAAGTLTSILRDSRHSKLDDQWRQTEQLDMMHACMHEAWNTLVKHQFPNEPVTAAIINARNDVRTSPLIIRTNAMASRLEEGYNVEGFVILSVLRR